MTDITLTAVPAQTVLGLRRRGRYQELIPQMIMELYVFVKDHGIEVAGMPVFVCHETSPEEVMEAMEAGTADVEVALPVAATLAALVAVPLLASKEGGEIVSCYELPGGMMAKAVHRGPYETSEATYNDIFAWVEKHGRTITGPIREVYLNDPAEVAPEEILTEIYVPIG